MANRKIQVDIFADAKGFKQGTNEAAQSASWLEKALGRLGPVGSLAQGALNRVGLSSISMGAGITGGAVVALGAAYEVGKKAIDQYVALGESIRNYSILTGQSAEQSSRQVQAFAVLGVSEETAAAGAVKLSKAIETTPQKLAALGIEIARNAQGDVDLGKTLLNVVSAYQATGDAAKKNEILLAAFGKGGAAMVPILEANAAELKRLEDTVGKVYTAEDLKRVHDYEISQKELKRSTDELGLNLGQALLPAWKANIDSINENIYVNKHLDERVQQLTHGHQATRAAIMEAGQALRDEYRAAQDASTAADTLAAAQQAAANAAQAEADAENKLYDSVHKSIDAEDSYKDAINRVRGERLRADQDAKAYDDAVKQHGKNSAEAAQADETYRSTLQSLAEAYKAEANDAVNMAEQQAAVNGTTLSATEKANIFRGELQKLEQQLSPNDPLRKNLQGYIDALDAIPADKTTTIHLLTPTQEAKRAAGGHGTLQFDEGGIVPGAPGAPVPAIVHGGEFVLNKTQQAALASGGARAQEIHIHIEGYYSDGPGLDKLANAIARRLSYATGR